MTIQKSEAEEPALESVTSGWIWPGFFLHHWFYFAILVSRFSHLKKYNVFINSLGCHLIFSFPIDPAMKNSVSDC